MIIWKYSFLISAGYEEDCTINGEYKVRHMKKTVYKRDFFYDRDCTQWGLFMKRTGSKKTVHKNNCT